MRNKIVKLNNIDNISVSWKESMKGFLFFRKANVLSKRTLKDYKEHIEHFFKR